MISNCIQYSNGKSFANAHLHNVHRGSHDGLDSGKTPALNTQTD